MLIKHGKGLQFLFMTEMWERFSFYTLRALLILYLTAQVFDGGLGWSKGDAFRLYGIYIGLAYLTPLFGGYLADRFLGQRRCAMIGAIMMSVGHFFMAFNHSWFFFSALGLVALGNGLFKPCLTAILGELYDDSSESQRDAAYSFFYMGINIGGALAGVTAGWLLNLWGYDAGFIAAGIAMLVATLVFWWGKRRFLGEVGRHTQVKIRNNKVVKLNKEEKKRIWAVGFIFLIVVFFFIGWEQIGALITLFINDSVDRHAGGIQLSTPLLANLDPIMIIILAPTLGLLWGFLGKKNLDPFLGAKMGIGCFLLSLSFLVLWLMSQVADQGVLPSWHWIILNKFFLSIGELCVVPISWAAVTRLMPSSYASRGIAVMLAAVAVGSYLSAEVGRYVEKIGSTELFFILMSMTGVLTLACFIINPVLKRLVNNSKH
jgi:proton-dependent oligopeptide transporter, POT family